MQNNNPSTTNTFNRGGAVGSRIYRNNPNNNVPVYLTFGERVQQSPYLISFESQDRIKRNHGKDKKKIISYVANKDKLFIPKPEKEHIPIDITANLVEEEKKVEKADLGIQIDPIKEEKNPKKFIPQKLGKDISTQIEDGELFCFNEDVKPLLTVIVGKTLEQSILEIEQEDEIANLREAKAMYIRTQNEDDDRIKDLENKEIQMKFNHDTKKEKLKQKRELRKNTQRELMSRVIAKHYLKFLEENAIKDLSERNMFRKYKMTKIKNKTNEKIKIGSEKLCIYYKNMLNYVQNMEINKNNDLINIHKESVNKHHIYLQKLKEQEERKKKEEEERIIAEDLARKERRRLRKIERIKKEIKAAIVDNGVSKSDVYNEEFNEIGNFNKNDEPYIGIYGDFFGVFLATLSFLKKDYYNNEDNWSIIYLSLD